MRVPVCLLLALAALGARAASIPAPTPNLDKKLAEVAQEVLNKDPEQQNASSEEQLIDQSNVIKDLDNKLKQATVDAIPVKVVVEDAKPALKSGEKKPCDKLQENDADENIVRAEIDLKHPGEPQRQEHDNQNPEPSENELDAAGKIKQMIKNTQTAFNDGVKAISNGINEWLHDQEPEVSIKQSIQNLQETFMDQINKLNSTIRGYWNPDEYKDSEKPVTIQNVESGLKVLEDNFESGVGNLTKGVRVLAALKSEIKETATTTVKPGFNPILPFFQSFFNGMTENFGNLTTQVQNFFNAQSNSSAAAAGAQGDESATQRPGIWQGIQSSIQGILNRPGQSQQPGAQSDEQAPSGPLAQAIQNNPFVQSVISFIQPKPQQPAAQPAAQPASDIPQSAASEGSNAVPEKPEGDQQQKVKPEQEAQPAPAKPASQPGPIQEIVQSNPIVQRVQGAVQKIQHNLMNPERPREEIVEDEKAGFYPYGGHVHHGHRPADVAAWSAFVSGLIGSISATLNGTALTVSNAVNSAINTLGTNIQVPGGFVSQHNNDDNSSGVVKSVEEVKKVASVGEPKELPKESAAPVKRD